MEEAAEVIQATSKAVRFGWGDYNPMTGFPNTTAISMKMRDLIRTWNELAIAKGLQQYIEASPPVEVRESQG